MEKLTLEKFKDFQIEKDGLKNVKAADGTCTGGGFRNNWLSDGNGSYVLSSQESWTSDSIYSDGSTIYYGHKYKTFSLE